MGDRIESFEDKIMSAASDDQKVAEKEGRGWTVRGFGS